VTAEAVAAGKVFAVVAAAQKLTAGKTSRQTEPAE
jgi:hypothetical protein